MKPVFADESLELFAGDAIKVLASLPEDVANCVVTSPPYWKMRDYAVKGQLGWEESAFAYGQAVAAVFDEVSRVLRPDGVVWLNVGDKFSKGQLLGIPSIVRDAMRESGWYWNSEVIWNKTNVRPESATKRVTHAHEYMFMFSQNQRYQFDHLAIKEPAKWERWGDQTVPKYGGTNTATGWMEPKSKEELTQRTTRNKRSVWSIPTANYPGSHDAVYPEDLVEPCILAGCPEGGLVLDPFIGSGTTAVVALRLGRRAIGIDLNRKAIRQTVERVRESARRT